MRKSLSDAESGAPVGFPLKNAFFTHVLCDLGRP